VFLVSVIFGVPLVVAATMLSPQGFPYILNAVARYAGIMLLLLPIFAWPTFLVQAIAPMPGQNRGASIVGLWLGGAVLVSAVLNLLGSMLDYSAHPLNLDPTGHELIGYDPQAGVIVGGITLCMLVSFGFWGLLARVLTGGFVLSGALLTGLLLFGLVGTLGYLLWPQQSPRAIIQASAGPRPAHVEDVSGFWMPQDGYQWVKSDWHTLRVEWGPGLPSLRHPHLVASDKEGKWEPQNGFDWVDPDRPGDYRVRRASLH